MDIKLALKNLENNGNFMKWRSKNQSNYFSYAFKIMEEAREDWHLGFYDKSKDKVTTFVMSGDLIEIRHEEELFKREETSVRAIDLSKIKLTFDGILAKAREFQKKNFPKDSSIKTIVILQNLAELGNIWNLTFVTQAFNTLNLKIDASYGKILEHNITSIFSFRQK